MKKISIVMPSCNWACLQPCLDSIVRNTDLAQHDAEVIVSLNGCDVAAIDYIKSLGDRFRFIWVDRRIGCCAATNLAAKISDGEFIVKMDDDNVILDWGKDYWLNLLLDPFVDKQVGQSGVWLQRQYNYDVLVGFLTMTTKKIWNQIGGFDLEFEPGGGEDIDFSIKVNKLGYKVVEASRHASNWPNWHKSTGLWRIDDVATRNGNILSGRYA